VARRACPASRPELAEPGWGSKGEGENFGFSLYGNFWISELLPQMATFAAEIQKF
jgi:hypothetical protein